MTASSACYRGFGYPLSSLRLNPPTSHVGSALPNSDLGYDRPCCCYLAVELLRDTLASDVAPPCGNGRSAVVVHDHQPARGRSTSEPPPGGAILQRHQSLLRQSKYCRRLVEQAGAGDESLLLIVAGNVAEPLEIVAVGHGNAIINAHTTRSAASQSSSPPGSDISPDRSSNPSFGDP